MNWSSAASTRHCEDPRRVLSLDHKRLGGPAPRKRRPSRRITSGARKVSPPGLLHRRNDVADTAGLSVNDGTGGRCSSKCSNRNVRYRPYKTSIDLWVPKTMPPGDIHESRPLRGHAAGTGTHPGLQRCRVAGAAARPGLGLGGADECCRSPRTRAARSSGAAGSRSGCDPADPAGSCRSNRSIIEFIRGAWTAERMTLTPAARNTA